MLQSVSALEREQGHPPSTDALALVAEDLRRVDLELEYYAHNAPALAASLLQHMLRAGGKRIRPALLLLSVQAAGGQTSRALRAAAAIELIHTATLVHDDVIDVADTRRGQPSAPRLWGSDISVLAGDYLFALGMRLLSLERKMEVVQAMSDAVNQMCAGQLLEIDLRKNLNVSEEQYLEVVRGKTAELISTACLIGPLVVCGGAPEDWSALSSYGRNVGIAFQIIDDVLDVLADRDQLGKPVGNDLREGKVTVPLIRTLRLASREDRQQIKTLLSQPDLDAMAVGAVTALIHRYDGIDYSRKRARDFARRGQRALEALPASPARSALAELAEFVVSRTC